MTDPIIELKRLNDEQLNDAMLLAGECALLRESIRALEADNLRLQAQVAELLYALDDIDEHHFLTDQNVDAYWFGKHAAAIARRAIASDGGKLLEVMTAAEQYRNDYKNCYYHVYIIPCPDCKKLDDHCPDALELGRLHKASGDKLDNALAAWRGEE